MTVRYYSLQSIQTEFRYGKSSGDAWNTHSFKLFLGGEPESHQDPTHLLDKVDGKDAPSLLQTSVILFLTLCNFIYFMV